MASIRKVGDKWVAEVRMNGRYLSRRDDKRSVVKEWAEDQERLIKNSSELILGKTLKDAFTRYQEEESPKKKGARWEKVRLNKLKRDKIADIQIVELTAGDFEDWITRQRNNGLSDATIRREIQLISPVLTNCRKWKWLDGSPLKDIVYPKDSPHREKTYNADQIDRICQALGYIENSHVVTIRQKIGVVFLLALETTMRWGEIWGLLWKNVHLDQRYAHLPDTKNGTPRDIPLTRKAISLLKSMPKVGDKVFINSPASAEVIFRRALKVAGIEGMTFHDTRHTATTRLAKKVDMLTLAKITGHKDPRMLMRYFNPTPSDIAEMLD